MNIQSLHIGMSVRHPQYGLGTVETISETTTDILFAGGKHTVAREATGLEAAEPQVTKSGLDIPLAQFIEQTVTAAINHLGLAKPDLLVEELRHFITAIQSGQPPTVVTAADGLSAVEICEAEEKSVETGRVVEL